MAESDRRIREIRDEAKASVEAVAVDTAEALVEAMVPGTGDAEAVQRAVSGRL